MKQFCYTGLWLLFLLASRSAGAQDHAQQVAIDVQSDRLKIAVAGQPVAEYVFADPEIPRPYFAQVHAPNGQQITRNHPPIAGEDALDHPTMHPGIWLAFGDLGGVDFWRNQGKIAHRRFSTPPLGALGEGSFTEEKDYLRPDGSVVCREQFRWSLSIEPHGYRINWDSVFSSEEAFYFGDQEEMGLGVRLATPIAEKNGGRLLDAEGRAGADEIWSRAAAWCDYSGAINDQAMGITIMAHPDNFRHSWWHARNYGFMAANPFGRQAMKQGELSRLQIEPGQQLRLRYGIWIHSGTHEAGDIEQAFAKYVRESK